MLCGPIVVSQRGAEYSRLTRLKGWGFLDSVCLIPLIRHLQHNPGHITLSEMDFLLSFCPTSPPVGPHDRGERNTSNAAFLLPELDPWSCFDFQDNLTTNVASVEYTIGCTYHPVEAKQVNPLPKIDFQCSPSMNTSHGKPTLHASQGSCVPYARAIQHSQVLPQVVTTIANGHHRNRSHVSSDTSTLAGGPSSQQPRCTPSFGKQYIPTPAPPNQHFVQGPVIPPYILPPSAPSLPPTITLPGAKWNRATSNSHHQSVTVQNSESSQATQPGHTTKPGANADTAQLAGYEPSLR